MATGPQKGAAGAVLVVDDDEGVRHYMVRVLSGAGFRVLAAADGLEAWKLVGEVGRTGVGAVVSDVAMPGLTGVELASRLASRWPTLPVLLVSARDRPLTCRGPYLQKPFAPAQLLGALRELLEGTARVQASR